MRSPRPSRGLGRVAALLAVALLMLAGVRSTVMQAAELGAPSMPMCGMGMDGRGGHDPAPGKAQAHCEFCAAAVHAPITAASAPLAVPTAVAWVVRRPAPAPGARGPPAFAAKARGPPPLLLTA